MKGEGVFCFIVASPFQFRGHNSPFLAVPVIESLIHKKLDVSGLLGDQGCVLTRTFHWEDGVGIEFHTVHGMVWNPATLSVMDELGIDLEEEEEEDDDENNSGHWTLAPPSVCTIITSPGKLPLSPAIYRWFCMTCKRSLY